MVGTIIFCIICSILFIITEERKLIAFMKVIAFFTISFVIYQYCYLPRENSYWVANILYWNERITNLLYTVPFGISIFGLVISLIFFIKWRKIRIFLSYNVENSEDIKLVKNKLTNFPSVEVQFIPFEVRDPNELIKEVSWRINKSDYLLVFPGNRKQSNFTDAEVLTALTNKKPIFLIRTKKDQHLPNTAFSGFPAFEHEYLLDLN